MTDLTTTLARGADMKPLLFLDVDGVLNCVGPRQDEHEFVMIDGTPCFVPHGTRARVHRLLEHFEPVWCTAWLGRAHGAWRRILDLGDGPSWPYVNYRESKITALIRFAAGRPFAYVDDDALGYELRLLGWTADMMPGFVIAPVHEVGLTDEHVDALVAFAAEATPKVG